MASDATAFPPARAMCPSEIFEARAPLLIRRRRLRPDSAGTGRWRGAFGEEIVLSTLPGSTSPVQCACRPNRLRYPPRGLAGGQDGHHTEVLLNGERMPDEVLTRAILPCEHEDDRVTVHLPGGAGYGPAERAIRGSWRRIGARVGGGIEPQRHRSGHAASGPGRGILTKSLEKFTQALRIPHGMAIWIVIEVDVAIGAVCVEAADTLCPQMKLSIIQTNVVPAGMDADIGPVRCETYIEWQCGAVGQAERGACLLQQPIDLRAKPGGMAELEGETLRCIGTQRLQKGGKALHVQGPMLGELEQDRAKLLTQAGRPIHQPGNRLLRVFELLHMGDIPAALDGEQEAFRCLLSPGLKHRTLR